MDKINEIKIQYRQTCENILKKKEKMDENDLNTIEKIILKDNTEPIFILTYLKLIKKFKKSEFLNKIMQYKWFLTKDLLEKEFPEFCNQKIPSSEILFTLFNKIMNCPILKNLKEKIKFYNELVFIEDKSDDIKGFIDYERNKELERHILVINIKKGIIKHIEGIKNYKVNENDFFVKMQQNIIKEAEIFKKVKEYKLNKKGEMPTDKEMKIYHLKNQTNKNYNPDDDIKFSQKRILLISKINSEDFLNYFDNFATFLANTKNNFKHKFKDIENCDFDLLMDFCFFLRYYNFKEVSLDFYTDKWNNTFTQSKEYIEKTVNKYLSNDYNSSYKLEDNSLILEIYKPWRKIIDVSVLENLDKYCIDQIASFLNNKIHPSKSDLSKKIDSSDYSIRKSIINEYSIEYLLKFNSIKDIYINKIWDIFENHLIRILTSKTIKSALKAICEKIKIIDYYDFLTEKDLKILLKRTKIFQFKTNVLGVTEPTFFINFIYYRGNIDYYTENCSKLLNFCIYQITQEHEMLGHLNVRLQYYLSKEKEISSPIIIYRDQYGNEMNCPELGDFIESFLYNRHITQLKYNEMLFLLDEENYNVEYNIFKNNFLLCNEGSYKISSSLSKFLMSLNIAIDDNFKTYEPLEINKDLVTKMSSEDNLLFNHQRHTHLHPSKDTISLQGIIDDYNKFELPQKKLNN